MPRYQFRLEAVQKVRVARRDQSRAALAEAFQAHEVLAENRAALDAEKESLRKSQRAAAAEPYLDVNRLLEAQQYDLVLRARQQELARQQSLLDVETERRRLALVEAEREVRVMELLDKRHRTAHRKRQERADIKQLDEVAAGQSQRGRRRAP
jgi:flagellar export protein FliJ